MSESSLKTIRRIDNRGRSLPIISFIAILLLIAISVWFIQGGSFRLYASVFFGLYFITKQIWLSVILIGIIQNIVFLPLRLIGLKLDTRLKNFEDELEQTSESQQYLLLNKKVREGDSAILFYILNFVIHAIAFFSAGRIFLIDFYSQPLDPDFLYSFVPYPHYPLQGTDFYFPFLNITSTIALPWELIIRFWLFALLIFIIPRFIWRIVKYFLRHNPQVLQARIGYNRFIFWLSGFIATLFILSFYLFRHLPTSAAFTWLVADLTRQNTTMNFITAVGTFITVLHAGYVTGRLIVKEARESGIPEPKISRLFRQTIRSSTKNALLLGAGAFLVTNQIPCAFELSVATFEVLYILSPLTFDVFLNKAKTSVSSQPTPSGVSS